MPVGPIWGASLCLHAGDSWRIYDYVVRHFLGSISPDCVFRRTKATLTCGGETFSCTGTQALRPGFTAVMPWRVS